MANDLIRMSGMNSGLDTESIINALTANSKLKVTKQERNVKKYEATQEAYRDIISKMQNIKNKYFDLLNKDSNLGGTSMWSKFASKTYVNGLETNVAGFTASTTINSQAGDYKFKVSKTASQAKIEGQSLSNAARVDVDAMTSSESSEYGMTVTVGDVEKNITFRAGATREETLYNINDALEKAFGESNSSSGTNADPQEDVRGMVYVDNNGQFVSRAGKGITVSGAGSMSTETTIDLTALNTGFNNIALQVGDEIVNASFSTIEADYFDDIFDTDGSIKEDADADKVALYNATISDYAESKRYEAYTAWKEGDTYESEKDDLLEWAFQKAKAEQFSNYANGKLEAKYDEYTASLGEDETAQSFDDWKAANYEETAGNALYDEILSAYKGTDYTQEQLDNYLENRYQSYVSGLGDDETAQSKEDWLAENQEQATADFVYSRSIELDKDLWAPIKYNEYAAYKEKNLGSITDESVKATTSNIDLVKHLNASNIKNCINDISTASGVSFSAEVGSNGKLSVTAQDSSGNARSFSVTAAQGSANTFGGSTAQVSISQITNSTKLSDLGIEADENGQYAFAINGKSFSFNGSTTVNDMMKKINASDAGVKMTYSSLNNAFTVTSSVYGIDGAIKLTDQSTDLLSAIGISDDNFKAGSNLEVYVNDSTEAYQVNGNALEIDGTTFTFNAASAGMEFTTSISQDTSAIADVIKNFVNDYNQLITDVYKYLDEKPEKDYYFLADADKEDLDLSEKQEEKWEEKAKKGLLYHDSTTTAIMSKLRTALMGSVEGLDGNKFSLLDLGIKTSSNYAEHGKFAKIDEDALNNAIATHSDDIMKLFTDSENGIMKKFSETLEAGIGTNGQEKGTLVKKAGLASGSTATDNELYNAIKKTKTRISDLTKRYEDEQNRLWKKYSSMESLLGTMNSQQASFSSYFMQ